MTGTYLAKMTSDICFKAPFDFDNWNYKNSDVLNSQWGEPPNFLQGVNQLVIYFGFDGFLDEDDE